jgi:hypothetical protein
MIFILKTLQQLFDRHIRDVVLVGKPLHWNQFAYTAGMSNETALFQVVHRLEKFETKSLCQVPSWILRGHLTIPLSMQLSRPQESVGLRRPVHEDLCIFMIITRLILLRMRDVADESCREKAHILCSITFSEIILFMR